MIHIEMRENEEHKTAMAKLDERRANLTGLSSNSD
jgi:hypothetical protein